MSNIIIGGANGSPDMVSSIMDAMQDAIRKYGLKLLERYPNDLLVHDKATLEEYAVPGAKIAWMVGHSHTHIAPLGLHADENETVTYLTNLANDDRFYIIKVHPGRFTMGEINREQFAALKFTPVHYTRQGSVEGFWLIRGKERVGHIALQNVGTLHEPKVSATITPVAGINTFDRSALEKWCQKAVVEMAHTLFVRQEVTWAEPVYLAQSKVA